MYVCVYVCMYVYVCVCGCEPLICTYMHVHKSRIDSDSGSEVRNRTYTQATLVAKAASTLTPTLRVNVIVAKLPCFLCLQAYVLWRKPTYRASVLFSIHGS